MTIWYSIDDGERRKYETFRVAGLPTTDMQAEGIDEEIIEARAERHKFEHVVRLYMDDKPATKPIWIVNVEVEWGPLFDSLAVKGDGHA